MAKLAAAFGTSHSVMLVCELEDWVSRFPLPDQKMGHYDFNGDPISYNELVTKAPKQAGELITPQAITDRYHRVQAAMDRMRDEIHAAKLDALIVVGDDQHELFRQENNPAIAIYYGPTIQNGAKRTDLPPDDWYRNAQNRRKEDGAPVDYPCDAALGLHLIKGLADQFDITAISGLTSGQSEGHAYSFIHRRYMREHVVPIVPIFINTYYEPNQPTPARCLELGKAIGKLIESFPGNQRIGIIASGGLSHFVVDEAMDKGIVDAIRKQDLNWLAALTPKRLQAGSSEIRNWICAAGAAQGLNLSWFDYIPGYRTPALTGTGLCFARWS